MPGLGSSTIISLAAQAAKGPGYLTQAGQAFNAVLSDLCETYDLAVARGVFNFNFNPANVSTFGSGPYPLPLDYLRTSGSSGSDGTGYSAFWTLLGVPYPMIPCDLADFDLQVQQAGLNSYPWLWATDMSQRTIVLNTYGDTAGSGSFIPAEGGGYLPAEGGGFLPAEGGPVGVISNLGSLDCLQVGMTVLGPGIPFLTTIVSIAAGVITLSGPCATGPKVPLMFGYPAVGFAYPPPSGNYLVTIRYQRDMPAIVSPETSDCVPWFPNSRFLIKLTDAMLMDITDDSRAAQHYTHAKDILDHYLMMKDDDTNRAKTVQLDRRIFGNRFSRLKNTKTIGW